MCWPPTALSTSWTGFPGCRGSRPRVGGVLPTLPGLRRSEALPRGAHCLDGRMKALHASPPARCSCLAAAPSLEAAPAPPAAAPAAPAAAPLPESEVQQPAPAALPVRLPPVPPPPSPSPPPPVPPSPPPPRQPSPPPPPPSPAPSPPPSPARSPPSPPEPTPAPVPQLPAALPTSPPAPRSPPPPPPSPTLPLPALFPTPAAGERSSQHSVCLARLRLAGCLLVHTLSSFFPQRPHPPLPATTANPHLVRCLNTAHPPGAPLSRPAGTTGLLSGGDLASQLTGGCACTTSGSSGGVQTGQAGCAQRTDSNFLLPIR
jgi:hypothetical protein